MVHVLDNSVVNLEFFPGKSGEQVQTEAKDQAQGTANVAQEKAKGAADSAAQTAQSTANTAQEKAEGAKQQASESGQSWTEYGQEKAQGAQQQAGEYQNQAADSLRGYGDTTQQQGEGYVQSGADYVNSAAKNNLPESTHSYAGSAVNYASNFATGTVGTVAGGVKDLGDTVGNAGYSTVAGVGKTGYNLGSGLGSAVTGSKAEEQGSEKVAEEEKTS